jgi:2-iminobutanoate/2-iminopropanoate deaminase
MTKIETVHTDRAPAAVGPYSQAVRVGDLLFCSGQIALDPQTGELVGQDTAEQTRQVLSNLRAVLEEAGAGLEHVVKTTVLLRDMKDFAAVNEVYAEFFGSHRPARAAFAVVGLPKDGLVEIEAVAHF